MAALLVFLAAVAPAEETFRIRDGEHFKTFEMACDALWCRPASGPAHAVAIPRQESARKAIGVARSMDGDSGARLDPLLYEAGRPRNGSTRRVLTRRIYVELNEPADEATAGNLVHAVGAAGFSMPRYAPGAAILAFAQSGAVLEAVEAVRNHPSVRRADPLLARRHVPRFTPNDPRFAWGPGNTSYQWHLNNTGQNGSVAGLDANVTGVWDNYRGAGVTIAIVDDGLEVAHPDIAPNANTLIDHDWNDDTPDDPTGTFSDDHGTTVGGVAAARGNNALGVSGAAPEAELVGLRLIAGDTTAQEDAEAMTWRSDIIDISNNSWGEGDFGDEFFTPGPLFRAALDTGVTTGRGGKGTIYVWAAGNGRDFGDYANYDGYNNAIQTISVGAVNYLGRQSFYSESGACLLVSAPSDNDDGEPGITTTTLVSRGSYTDAFGGTSSAAPLASGIIALALQKNPNLGWRDVQELLVRTSGKIDPTDSDWTDNGAGFHFNHKYGAGMIDAAALVAMADGWQNLGTQQTRETATPPMTVPIPDNDANGVALPLAVGGTPLRVEHVELAVNIAHTRRGDLNITLTSPSGTESRLAETHNDNNAGISYTFMTVRHWGEMSDGSWTVRVSDGRAGTAGTLGALGLKIYGTESASGYEAWVAAHFTAAEQTAGLADPLADPEKDGRVNLLEYALRTLPKASDSATNAPTAVRDGAVVRFRYEADTAKTDIAYAFRVSGDLAVWTPLATTVVATNGTIETREVAVPVAGGRLFGQVTVSRM